MPKRPKKTGLEQDFALPGLLASFPATFGMLTKAASRLGLMTCFLVCLFLTFPADAA